MGVILLKKLISGRPTSSVRPPRRLRFRAASRPQRLAYDGEVQLAVSELWDRP